MNLKFMLILLFKVKFLYIKYQNTFIQLPCQRIIVNLMRRSSYHQKVTQYLQKSQNPSNLQFDLDQFNLHMGNIKHDSNNPKMTHNQKDLDSNYLNSSRTNRYNQLYKQAMKTPYKRPYTSQKSNSVNQIIRKQDYDNYAKKQNGLTAKSNVKPQAPAKDLWINTVKEYTMKASSEAKNRSNRQKDNAIMSSLVGNSSKFHDISMQKGKIHRGISFKGAEQKIFLRDMSFDSKRKKHMSSTSRNTPSPSSFYQNQKQSQYQPSTSKQKQRNSVMDLIGKNLQRSMTPNSGNNDNFLEYVMRFSYKTKKGYAPSNPNKVNQDAYITSPNLNNKTWQHLFGICDGHGPLGHLVSNYVKSTLPLQISALKNLEKSLIPQRLQKAFQSTYQKLVKQSHIDMSFSGSTVIIVYLIQERLFCCNVGDSRAIMCRQVKKEGKYSKQKSKDKKWEAVQLSTDHKPSIPQEAERIRRMKGRVEAYRDEFNEQIGPLRVWLKNDNVPGLAMTRSFGDLVGASVGVSHQPQIKQFTLTIQSKIILIASDGEIMNALIPFYQKKQVKQASDYLLSMSHRSWTQNSSIVDDITFVLIFMNYEEII